MEINSLRFLTFFVIVFLVYHLVIGKYGKLQNLWLLASSYVFYGIAEWKMIPLLIIATFTFYCLGLAIEKYNTKDERRASCLTFIGTCLGIGILLYFKYLNFFIESFAAFFNAIGLKCNMTTFDILMPLGISFFTFKLIAYIIEVHRGHIAAERDIIAFGTYIAFFPTILSGPIDRPQKFLPQLQKARAFNYDLAEIGCKQILWGMFKKMVIADTLASTLVDPCWENVTNYGGLTMILAILLYPLEMYADFSGYSDMAIGIGKLLGIKVAVNFKYPFFGRNIAEYWRNWHISLTSWLTDYVFMPLNIATRNLGIHGSVLAIIINFVLIGMWHGASWTFIIFGLYHGILYIPLMYSGAFYKKNKLQKASWGGPIGSDLRKMCYTYLVVAAGLILFKATDLSQAANYISSCLDFNNMTLWINVPRSIYKKIVPAILCCIIMLVLEWRNCNAEFPHEKCKFNVVVCGIILWFITRWLN